MYMYSVKQHLITHRNHSLNLCICSRCSLLNMVEYANFKVTVGCLQSKSRNCHVNYWLFLSYNHITMKTSSFSKKRSWVWYMCSSAVSSIKWKHWIEMWKIMTRTSCWRTVKDKPLNIYLRRRSFGKHASCYSWMRSGIQNQVQIYKLIFSLDCPCVLLFVQINIYICEIW